MADINSDNNNITESKSDKRYLEINEKYMKPMDKMSSALNERVYGYSSIASVLKKSIRFVSDNTGKSRELFDSFIDKTVFDFIRIFMYERPDINEYCSQIHSRCNNPTEKKYFKLICDNLDEETITENAGDKLLFIIAVITAGFDVFYPHYRAKVTVTYSENSIDISFLYEVRADKEISHVYKYVLSVMKNILKEYADDTKLTVKDSLVQYKALINC